MNPSNEPTNNVNTNHNNNNNNKKNSGKMSTNDISNRLQTLQDRLKEPNNEMGGRRRPDNFGAPIGRRERLGLGLPLTQMNRVESETDNKFKQIMKRSGILTINGVDFKTDIKDLDDLGELGNGTSGHVVKMKHKPTNTIIAVKQMRRTNNNEENKRITMDIEVVLKSHDCPFIVHCLGCFITDAEVWICMELMTTCFDKLLKRTKTPVPEPILGKITVATVKALSFLKNNHDVIHRDVKPSNILVDECGNIKLCDFGISGRLVDSKANTRSAGCAAYMAPERIDPKKKEYDIRADVWSLGITLVELATSTLPYKGCNNEFEVLTCILENNPPSLPTEGFSIEFQTFVQKCLTKESGNRPKYAELLQSDFIKRYEAADVDVASWLASYMQPKQQKNELHRSIADKNIMPQSSISTAATAPAFVPTTAIAITSNHLPVYQLNHNNSVTQTNDRSYNQISNVNIENGWTIESAMNANPFQLKNHTLNTNDNLNTINQAMNNQQQPFKQPQHQPQHINDEGPIKEFSLNRLTISNPSNSNSNTNYHHNHQKTPSTVSNASSSATTQFTFNNVSNLSRTPSITERDRISDCPLPLPMMPTTNFPRTAVTSPLAAHQQLRPDERYPIVKSPIPMIPIRDNDEYNNVTTNQNINYQCTIPQSEHPTQMPYDEQNFIVDEHLQQRRQSVSPQMLHFQQIEERMADELNELYKATMRMHAHQQQKRECRNETDQMKPQYMPREPIYNNDPARHQLLQRNNSLSPYLQRKYSLQRPSDQNVNRWRGGGPQYGRSISATASPNLDGRRRFQTAIPVLDDDRSQMVRLKGNTSPIVLQRFYHQQNQLRERGVSEQFYNGSSSHSQMQYIPDHEIYSQRDAYAVHMTKNDSQTNPFMKHIPKLTQKLNPFKQQSPKRKEAIYANTNILLNPKSYGHDKYDGDTMQRENIHLQRIPVTPPVDIYNNYEKTYSNYKDHYPAKAAAADYKNAYNDHGTPLRTSGKKSNGVINHRDDPGWFNSIASVVKRRFASYVKTHLGDSSNTKNPMQPSSPYHFEKLRPALQTASVASTSMPSSPHFGNRSHADHHHYERERLSALSPRMLNNADRRHRSPDPPPRYNKGQSPLLLRRNLLEYGNHQVAPSPLLPRRYISASPPLPPPRKGSDSMPSSPQQFRARVHYTPEPQRRIYRTIDQ